MTILINVLLTLDLLVALLMSLVILMQRPKSEGLGAAFGGGVTENIFGAQTTNVLTKFTGWLAGIFFICTFVLSILYAQRSFGRSSLSRRLLESQAAATAPATASVTPLTNAAAIASPAAVNAPAATEPTVKPSDLAVGAVPAPPVGAVSGPSVSPAPTLPRSP